MKNSIGDRIAFLRKQNNMTQLQLSEKLHISDKTISKWESNKGNPCIEMFEALSDVFDCSLDYLIKGSDKNYFMLDDLKFAERCFSLLKEKIGDERYEKFFEKYKFLGIDDYCFSFSTKNKEIFEIYSNSEYNDEEFDILICEIAMNLNEKVNGFKLDLDEN